MSWLSVVLWLYALLNIGGGIAGYVEKHSVPSIISGVAAGALVIASIFMGTNNQKMYTIAVIVALADLGFFGMKFAQTKATWPAGIMIAASLGALFCLGYAHFAARR